MEPWKSEILRRYIKPPPNKTVYDLEPPPPYHPSSDPPSYRSYSPPPSYYSLSFASGWSHGAPSSSGYAKGSKNPSSTVPSTPSSKFSSSRLYFLSAFGDSWNVCNGSKAKGEVSSSSTLAELKMVPCKAEEKKTAHQ